MWNICLFRVDFQKQNLSQKKTYWFVSNAFCLKTIYAQNNTKRKMPMLFFIRTFLLLSYFTYFTFLVGNITIGFKLLEVFRFMSIVPS